ncbi:sister chromatid cohesion protein SCC4 [Selaginella moellendorffii]|uniref:sister chromatid cohesion protein SCC4 n=1 Tax=Selaginella moellendorffii TaxID=88036 RepID=UPI000D1CEBEA|nr:sister chromatid cohesion protein SCC4 [Selaginella moellendorffii]|eukprot:XP_024528762.1 sister chromatid cohesion protein SCC4 [Selaginella moellendorffii]
MDAVAEGLWILADRFEQSGNISQAVKCLEAICQSRSPFLPIVEVKTRLQLATVLLNYTDNLLHAKNHLERAQLLLKQIPSCFELKCRAYSLLSRCYHLVGTIGPQKQVLKKGLDLAVTGDGLSPLLWVCNFNLQLANALTIEGDFPNVIRALEAGLVYASKAQFPQLQLLFAVSMLHVHLMESDNLTALQQTVSLCDQLWDQLPHQTRELHPGLHVYNQLLHVFYFLRVCDYKAASHHVELLDAALSSKYETARLQLLAPEEKQACMSTLEMQDHDLQKEMKILQGQLKEQGIHEQKRNELVGFYHELDRQLEGLKDQERFYKYLFYGNAWKQESKLPLGVFPLDGEWLPTGAVLILVDLMAVTCARPKGMFKETTKRLQSGLSIVNGELGKLGITSSTQETHLPHWSIWMAGVYLVLQFQLLENKILIDLTRTEFMDAQKALMEVLDLYFRFPTILQGCESSIHMLLGHYAHSVGCFQEGALHFIEAAKLTESKALKALCHVYSAISLICLGDADSCSQALDLIGPVYRSMDSFIGVREKTLVLFASGLLQMKQHNPQEARTRLANGLKLTHKQLGNHQLVSQYLTVLGSLALAIHDTSQALDILKSSFTLAKALHDVSGQIGVLTELTALYRELGEGAKLQENFQFEERKVEELARHIQTAVSSSHHMYLLKHGLNQET